MAKEAIGGPLRVKSDGNAYHSVSGQIQTIRIFMLGEDEKLSSTTDSGTLAN